MSYSKEQAKSEGGALKGSETTAVSVVIPAKNEQEALSEFLGPLCDQFPEFEIIVVDDGSTDDTCERVRQTRAQLVQHPYSMGNGAAIKTGARQARGDILVLMDGDGQHQMSDIPVLLNRLNEGFDMVVGARQDHNQASWLRLVGNRFYNWFAGQMVNQPIMDLTSGFRAVRRGLFMEFLHLLPNKFSYPSTITMAFFRCGYRVSYLPIHVLPRKGKSHLKVVSDGFRFLIIIYKVATLYSPLKVFLPFAVMHFLLGLGNYMYTYITQGRFTNMSAMLISASVIIFLIGLVSEQITTLMYQQKSSK